MINRTSLLDSEINTTGSSASGKKDGFLSDVLKIGFGASFAQVLLVLIAPILTRLYNPEAFGLAALFISISTILGGFVSLRYELSIMLPEKDEDAANLLVLSLVVTVLISTVAFFIMMIGRSWIVGILNSPDLLSYLYLIPFSVFFLGVARLLNYWNSRMRQYGKLSLAKILNSIATGGTQLVAGFSGFSRGGGLIIAYILGWGVASLFLAVRIWHDNSKLFIENIRMRLIMASLVRYKKFPLISTWSGLLNSLSSQTPTLLLAAFFSPLEVGFYALGHRVLRMPLDLIGASVAQVFYQRASEANRQGNLALIVEKVFIRLVSLGMFPLLLLTITGRELFVIAFGENWAEAGVYMQILALWTFFVFISNPISTLVNTLEKQEVSLFFNTFLIISRVASLVIGGLLGSVYIALVLFSLSGVLSWMWFCFWLLNKSGVKVQKTLQIFTEYLLISLPFLGLAAYITYYTAPNPITISAVSGMFIMIYYGIVIGRDKELIRLGYELFMNYWPKSMNRNTPH
jgi:lipopolysaccharide exporter